MGPQVAPPAPPAQARRGIKRTPAAAAPDGAEKEDAWRNRDETESFRVKKILAERHCMGTVQWKVEWQGYPLSEATWIKWSQFDQQPHHGNWLVQQFELKRERAKRDGYRKQREDGQAVAGIALAAVKVRQIRPPNPCPVPLVLFRSF